MSNPRVFWLPLWLGRGVSCPWQRPSINAAERTHLAKGMHRSSAVGLPPTNEIGKQYSIKMARDNAVPIRKHSGLPEFAAQEDAKPLKNLLIEFGIPSECDRNG